MNAAHNLFLSKEEILMLPIQHCPKHVCCILTPPAIVSFNLDLDQL